MVEGRAVSWAVVAGLAVARVAGAQDPAGIEFFEKKIRPVLAEHCHACHSAQAQSARKLKANLYLDSLEGMLQGGDLGPAIVPGDPDGSLLLRVIRHVEKDLKMPLDRPPLPAPLIADVEAWIRAGAPAPRANAAGPRRGPDPERVRAHWAFQPLKDPPVPEVKLAAWPRGPIDRFVLAKLEEKGLRPAPPADSRTLLRRLSYALTGLPPTPEETAAFQRDPSPRALENVVDRLLASAAYGERWGRIWLDVARYADTKGVFFVGDPRELLYPHAYTYRDWVVRALNEDMPYDRFVLHQIAADRLVEQDDTRPLAALGFLTLGRRFQNNIHDIIDDRIDVVTRGTLALTVSCARCHDHKFDPIPTQDYYSLYGVFAASREKTVPLVEGKEASEASRAYEAELRRLKRDVRGFLSARRKELLARWGGQVEAYLMAARAEQVARRDLHPKLVERWRVTLEAVREEFHPVWGPWNELAGLRDEPFARRAAELASDERVNPAVAELLAASPPATPEELARRYGELLAGAGAAHAPAPLREALYGEGAPLGIPLEASEDAEAGIEAFLDPAAREEFQALEARVLEHTTSAAAPPQAVSLQDRSSAPSPKVFIRGNPDRRGEEVPRRFLQILSGDPREPFRLGSGRLEMARAIADPGNPLTARVMVNRVWLALFGEGLVRTPSDFGLRSEPPSHPELLDYLACRFIEDGWSLKKLIRRIVLGAVYRQSVVEDPERRRLDPENRLLWTMNRRRLDLEALRDSLLCVSGLLEPTIGGPPVELTAPPFPRRRTLYGFIARENLPGLFPAFDFPEPAAHSPQRFTTTVPQQALYLMNSPFVQECARALARRAERRVEPLYGLVYQRAPTPQERALAERFIAGAGPGAVDPGGPQPRVWRYGTGAFDEQTARVKSFQEFAHWTGEKNLLPLATDKGLSWQAGPEMPDPKAGFAMLAAERGFPGPDLRHAVIRRWIAPRDGTVSIEATFAAPALFSEKSGDGVRGRIVSSRSGLLGTWTVRAGFTATRVEGVGVVRGDTIDFVVDCLGHAQHDTFLWAPLIRMDEAALEWNAASDFAGPPEAPPAPLTPWDRYAQVLLMSNEFMFLE
jgi:hypothetical protein